MTRGFIVLVKNGEIYKVVESYGDSYLSGLGLKVINMMENNTLVEAFRDIEEVNFNESYEEVDAFNEPVKPIFHLLGYERATKKLKSLPLKKEAFIKTKATKDANEHFHYAYTYMYDIDKDYLDIIYYGEKQIKLTRDLIPSIKKFIELDELYIILSFDEKTGRNSKDHSKEVKKLFKTKPTPEELQSIKNNFIRKLYIDDTKYSDGHSAIYESAYKRYVRNMDGDIVVEFIIQEPRPKVVELVLCTPFYRIIIKRTTSKTKAENIIKDLVIVEEDYLILYKEMWDSVQRTLDFLKELEKMNFDSENYVDRALDKLMTDTLDKLDSIGEYFGFMSFLPKDKVKENLIRNIRNTRARIIDKLYSNKLESTI